MERIFDFDGPSPEGRIMTMMKMLAAVVAMVLLAVLIPIILWLWIHL